MPKIEMITDENIDVRIINAVNTLASLCTMRKECDGCPCKGICFRMLEPMSLLAEECIDSFIRGDFDA